MGQKGALAPKRFGEREGFRLQSQKRVHIMVPTRPHMAHVVMRLAPGAVARVGRFVTPIHCYAKLVPYDQAMRACLLAARAYLVRELRGVVSFSL